MPSSVTFTGTYTLNGGEGVAAGTVTITPEGQSATTATLDGTGFYSVTLAFAGRFAVVETITGVAVRSYGTSAVAGATVNTGRDVGTVRGYGGGTIPPGTYVGPSAPVTAATAATVVGSAQVTGDAQSRFNLQAGGTLDFGTPGNLASRQKLYPTATGMEFDGTLNLRIENPLGTTAPELHFHSQASDGSFPYWLIGTDIAGTAADPVKGRHFVLANKVDWPAAGNAYDFLTVMHGGANPPVLGLGGWAPDYNYLAHFQIHTQDLTKGTLRLGFTPSQTGAPLLVRGPNADALRVDANGKTTFVVNALAAARTTGATAGLTNASNAFTVSGADATNSLTQADVGKAVTSSVGGSLAANTVIQSVTSATTGTLSAAATGTSAIAALTFTAVGSWGVQSPSGLNLLSLDPTSSGYLTSNCLFNGFGPGLVPGTLPTANLDVVALGSANATAKFRTGSWGVFNITALGASPGTVTIGTSNGTPLNLQTNAADRIKIGTAGQLHFAGGTPVAQQTAAVAATDATTTQALANSLRTILINLGLAA